MKVTKAGRFDVLDFPPKQPDWDFWPMWADGRWESSTKAIIDEYTPGRRCVDVGAWVGPTVLWMVEAGAVSVDAYEPDPVAFGVLRANVLLNRLNVACWPYAVASSGTVDLAADDFGESISGAGRGHHSLRVDALSVADVCDGAEFVKVDIEGAELGLLPEFAAVGCPMLISTHAPWWPAGARPDWSGWSEVRPLDDGGGFGEVLVIP